MQIFVACFAGVLPKTPAFMGIAECSVQGRMFSFEGRVLSRDICDGFGRGSNCHDSRHNKFDRQV